MRRILLIILCFVYFNGNTQPELILPIGHTNFIYAFGFTNDGQKLLSASSDNTLKLWDVSTGKLIKTLSKQSDFITDVQFSSDGNYMVSAAFDSTVIIWDAKTFTRQNILKLPTGRPNRILISGRNDLLVTISEDDRRTVAGREMLIAGQQIMHVWDLRSGKLLHSLDSVWGSIPYAEISKDGKTLVTVISQWIDFGKRREDIFLWDLGSGKIFKKIVGQAAAIAGDQAVIHNKNRLVIKNLKTDAVGWTSQIAFSELQGLIADSLNQFVYEYFEDSLAIRSMKNGKLVKKIHLTGGIKGVKVSPDGKFLGVEGTIYSHIINTNNLNEVMMLEAPLIGASIEFSTSAGVFASQTPDYALRLQKIGAGQPLYLQGQTSPVRQAKYSPDGKFILLCLQHKSYPDWSVILWDSKGGAPIHQIIFKEEIDKIDFTNDSRAFVSVTADGKITYWDVATGLQLKQFEVKKSVMENLDIHHNSEKYVKDGVVEIVLGDLRSGKEIASEANGDNDYQHAIFNPKGDMILAHEGNGLVSLLRTSDLKRLYTRSDHGDPLDIAGKSSFVFSPIAVPIQFSSDGAYFLTASNFGPLRVWETVTGKIISELSSIETFTKGAFSADNKEIVTVREPKIAEVWDAISGTKKGELAGHDSRINSAFFHPTTDQVITGSDDNTIRIWSNDTVKLMLFPTVDGGYFIQEPSGYYRASKDASTLLHYSTDKLKLINFEQLDVKYNRPDIILRTAGSTDTALIDSYQRSYQKRLKKLGLDNSLVEGAFSIPEVELVNRGSISAETTTGKISLHIAAKDDSSYLDRFNIWINEVPLFDMTGISIRHKSQHTLDTTISVSLVTGLNVIETSVINQRGTESYRTPLHIYYQPETPVKERVHFIGIGLNHFQAPGHDLNWSVKDIRDLAKSLKEKYGSAISIDTLFDENVTESNVLALKEKLKKSSIDDKVIIAYSGHGLLSNDFDYYLSTYNVSFSDPEINGLPYDALEGLMDGIPARKKLMLIDACHSGEVDKEEMEKYTLIEPTLEDSGTKSGRKPVQTEGKLGMKNSFELMQELFVNVSRGTGATVISAAAGTQFAQEKGSLQNGVFTYSILEYMKKNPTATVSQLKEYVNRRVSELTNGLQVPTARSETRAVDWRVW